MDMFKIKPTPLKSNEQGFASLVIALTLIVIMALISVGFAQLARREQLQALNKHLAVQATYAAESAVNDAVADIQNGTITTSNTTCGPSAGTYLSVPDVSSSLAVSYNCVLVNEQPPDLLYNPVEVGSSQNVTLTSGSGQAFSTITIEWSSDDSPAQTSYVTSKNATPFLPKAQWNANKQPPVLEASLTNLGAPAAFQRNNLITNTYTNYLYPYTTTAGPAASLTLSSASQGKLFGNCSNGNPDFNCSATFDVASLSSDSYLFHFLDYYDNAKVLIKGTLADGTPATFKNGQAIVDATGKAQDVLKRLQVRVPLSKNTTGPNQGLEAGSICKRIETYPGYGAYVNTDGSPAVTGEPCYLDNNPQTVTTSTYLSSVTASSCQVADNCAGGNGGGSGVYVGDYNWSPGLYNESPANQPPVTSCNWNFGAGTSPGNKGVTYPGTDPVCQHYDPTATPALGINSYNYDASTSPYADEINQYVMDHPFSAGCGSGNIKLANQPVVVLTLYFKNAPPAVSTPESLELPYCHQAPSS